MTGMITDARGGPLQTHVLRAARVMAARVVITAAAMMAAVLSMTAAGLCQELPGIKRDRDFDELTKTLDLEQPGLEFVYKTGRHQGSSVGFHIAEPGHRKSATFLPYNSSSDPEAEVVSYRLARFLGVSDIYNPVTYTQLGPLAAARFKLLLSRQRESDPDRRANYLRIVNQLNVNPKSIFGIYRHRPKGNKYPANSLGFAGQFNQGSAMAPLIQASGPLPTDKLISLPGVKGERPEYPKPAEKESELARQLSVIMVVDQLMGQWDRFWRNLEASGDSAGRLQLLARDNGGATVDDWEWHGNYNRWVSRYDRDVMATLSRLHSFLKGSSPRFAGFDDVGTWKTAVGFRKASSFATFKRKLELLVEKRLPGLERQYGARVYFEGKHPQPQRQPDHQQVALASKPASEPEVRAAVLATPAVTPPPATPGQPAEAPAVGRIPPAVAHPEARPMPVTRIARAIVSESKAARPTKPAKSEDGFRFNFDGRN
jgi:hypothetical protein